jgi:hypothetical protein
MNTSNTCRIPFTLYYSRSTQTQCIPVTLYCDQPTQTQETSETEAPSEDSEFGSCKEWNGTSANSLVTVPPHAHRSQAAGSQQPTVSNKRPSQAQCRRPNTGLGTANILNTINAIERTVPKTKVSNRI